MELPDVLQVKFEGGGVSPQSIRLTELAPLFRLLEEYFVHRIRQQSPDLGRDEIRLSLNVVRRASATYGIVSPTPEQAVEAFRVFGDAVKTNNFLGLPSVARDLAKTIVAINRRHDCNAHLISTYRDEKYSATLTPDTHIGDGKPLRGDTSYYGKLERVGGAEPRFTLRISGDEALRGDVSQDLAIELAKHLYRWVGVKGEARWNPVTGEVEAFRATEIIPYRGPGIAKAVEQLSKAIGEYWDDEDDVVGAVRAIRGGTD